MADKAKVTRALVDRKPKDPFAVSESPSIIAQYTRDINRLVRKMTQLVRRHIIPVLRKYEVKPAKTASGVRGFQVTDDSFGLELQNAYNGILAEFKTLNEFAKRIAANRMLQANQAHRRKFIGAWKKSIGVNVSPLLSMPINYRDKLTDKDSIIPVNQAIQKNIELIKTIPEQQLDLIKEAIEKNLALGQDNWSLKGVADDLVKVDKKTKNRAKLIARDQLQKLNGVLNQARQQSLGVNGYIWRTSADERVRDSHKSNDGKRFQWDKPPSGTGHPGEDINCRCVAEPDLSQIIPSLAPELQKFGPRARNRISV